MSTRRALNRSLIAALLLLSGVSAAASSQAQANTLCQGRVVVDSVFQVSTGAGQFEYFVQVRNQTNQPIQYTLLFSAFTADVRVHQNAITVPAQGPHASQRIRFGNGTKNNVNSSTMKVVYDKQPATGTTVRAVNCDKPH